MNPHELSKSILSELQQGKLEQFAADPLMVESVKLFLLAVAYRQGVIEKGAEHVPTRNWAMNLAWGAIDPKGMPRSDEELGQNLRALTHAIQLVGSGFQEIEDLKKTEEVTKSDTNNPAE